MPLTKIKLEAPYLVYLGDVDANDNAKTGFGIVHWRRDLVAGQLRFPGCNVDLGVPDMTVTDASWTEYVSFLSDYDARRVEQLSGLPAASTRWLASIYCDPARKVLSIWDRNLNAGG